MISADELQPIAPGLALWHAFEPEVKSELFSTAVALSSGLVIVDPIPLTISALEELDEMGPAVGIIVTNSNHWRASATFAQHWKVPIFGHADLQGEATIPNFIPVSVGERILDALEVISIAGAAPGEIALHWADKHGSVIMGDALINFEPYGFTFLPAKYCTDHKEMRHSLRQLLRYEFDRMLFAHGTPILSGAATRLKPLLHDG